MFTGSCRATFFVCESASSQDIVAQGSHVPCERRGLDLDRSRGGSSKMSLERTESQLSTDIADNTKQDFRVRVPEFEVAIESRTEEVKPLAKARTVIWQEKCGAEFFSCGLIHTSFLQLSRSVVSMRSQRGCEGDLGPFKKRVFSRSGTVDDSYCSCHGGRQPLGVLLPLRVPYEGGGKTCRTREAESLIRLENSTKEMLPRCRYLWALLH